jgi:hypothetical protein
MITKREPQLPLIKVIRKSKISLTATRSLTKLASRISRSNLGSANNHLKNSTRRAHKEKSQNSLLNLTMIKFRQKSKSQAAPYKRRRLPQDLIKRIKFYS